MWRQIYVTEDIWDNGGSSETDDLDWTELSDKQKEAALFIGYTEEMWRETNTVEAKKCFANRDELKEAVD